MKNRLRTLSWRLIDGFVAGLVPLIAVPLLAYKRGTARRLVWTREMFRRLGVYPIFDHYYQPLFQSKHFTRPLDARRTLPGIQLRQDSQLELLQALREFSPEVQSWRTERDNEDEDVFFLQNGNFEGADADFLYLMLRYLKPRRVLEVGSGQSTKVAALALEVNASYGVSSDHSCIEPYEADFLERLPVQTVRSRLQDTDLTLFSELERGDVLFIDSSHMVRPQGEVLILLLQVLPSLRSGVYIHIHDVFTPWDYPKEWHLEDVTFWNEQYLVEALLSTSTDFEVVAGLKYLAMDHWAALSGVCPHLGESDNPGSFWIRKT